MFWDLPQSLDVAGRTYDIDSDFRTVLRVLAAYADPDLSEQEKILVCLANIYIDVSDIPPVHLEEAYRATVEFIDGGQKRVEADGPPMMDWEQDAPLIFSAINHVAGFEVRSADYLHWFTFLGYFMEIKEGAFATVMRLRRKRNQRQKLEKPELDFWNANRNVCELKQKLSEKEQAAYDRFNALFS